MSEEYLTYFFENCLNLSQQPSETKPFLTYWSFYKSINVYQSLWEIHVFSFKSNEMQPLGSLIIKLPHRHFPGQFDFSLFPENLVLGEAFSQAGVQGVQKNVLCVVGELYSFERPVFVVSNLKSCKEMKYNIMHSLGTETLHYLFGGQQK